MLESTIMTLKLIYDLDLPALTDLLKSWGEPAYRARQIWRAAKEKFERALG